MVHTEQVGKSAHTRLECMTEMIVRNDLQFSSSDSRGKGRGGQKDLPKTSNLY